MPKKQDIKPGYKKTALGLIPDNWEVVFIGTLGETYGGISGKTKEDFGYGLPYIPYLNIFNNTVINTNHFDYVNINPDEKQNKVQNGDLLFTTSSETPEEVGMCSTYTGELDVYLNSFSFGLKIKREYKVSSIYLSHFFRSQYGRRLIYRLAQGATRYNLSAKNLLAQKIPIPTLPEQKAVADCLSTWDRAIEKQSQLIEAKKQFKKGLMQGFFSGQLTVENGELIKAKEGEDFTKDWDKVSFDKIFKEVTEINNDSPINEIMTISSTRGLVLQKEKFDRVIAGDSLKRYTLIKKGDFSYNKGNSKTYPHGCIYQLEQFENALVPFVYISFRAKEKIVSKFYNFWFLNYGLDRQLKTIITSGVRGDGLLNVSKKDFFNLKVPNPNLKIQQNISDILVLITKEIELQEKKLEQLQLQKKGLMQVLLTGERRLLFK